MHNLSLDEIFRVKRELDEKYGKPEIAAALGSREMVRRLEREFGAYQRYSAEPFPVGCLGKLCGIKVWEFPEMGEAQEFLAFASEDDAHEFVRQVRRLKVPWRALYKIWTKAELSAEDFK